MSFGDLAPILGIVLTALLGVLTYSWQEREKRRTALDERRQALYEDLIRALIELLAAETPLDRSMAITKIEKGWLFASDKVLRAYYRYLETYDELCSPLMRADGTVDATALLEQVRGKETREKLGRRLAAIFWAMRRDIRRDSRITRRWARDHFEIYAWGIVAKEAAAATEAPKDASSLVST